MGTILYVKINEFFTGAFWYVNMNGFFMGGHFDMESIAAAFI